MGPRNHVLDGSRDRTNLFAAAMGDKSAMRPIVKILRPVVLHLGTYALGEATRKGR